MVRIEGRGSLDGGVEGFKPDSNLWRRNRSLLDKELENSCSKVRRSEVGWVGRKEGENKRKLRRS